MNRREMLKAAAVLGSAALLKTTGAGELLAQTLSPDGKAAAGAPADLVAVMGGEPADLLARALSELGGLKRYVKKGQRVAVKPNIGWAEKPERAATTNPDLVAALVRNCLTAGAAEVLVFDHTCDGWNACYQTSGIAEAAEEAGGHMAPAHEESYYQSVPLPRGRILKETKAHRVILDCDVWINAPVLKHHGGTSLSIAMKNYMGLVWDRRAFHRNDLQQCIADVCTLEKRPALNVVDAYRVVVDHGPRGRSTADVATPRALLISGDIVAVDTAAAKFFSQLRPLDLDQTTHIAKGAELGLGTANIEALNIKRLKL